MDITWFTDYIKLSKLKLNPLLQGSIPMVESDCDEHYMIGYRITIRRRWFGLFNLIKKEDNHLFGYMGFKIEERNDGYTTDKREHELNKLLPEQITKYWIGQSIKKFI